MFPGRVTALARGRVELSSDGVGLLALGKVPQGLRYRWATDGVVEVLCILKVRRCVVIRIQLTARSPPLSKWPYPIVNS